MPDIIKLLPDSIANQIAAGEVIQRPASAVKELLENAVDAGSSEITLVIKDAGKALIQVIDNGCGMSETDARMSFERHATSKIKSADDLFAIRTMGFRGEALASIAAIAQVELKTRKFEEEVGTQIIIEGSEVKSQEPCQCAAGTSIAIKNLFFNTPARRNFLKSNTVESRHIIDEFQHVALANPDIQFSLYHNDLELFRLPAGNLRKRIIGIFGNSYNEKLVPVEESTSVVDIQGYIGKPESARKTRGEQFFFVNNRFIKSHYLNHSITNAFDELLPNNTYPFYVLFLRIDPARIDVNVHPTKQEIKFDDERIIYAYLHSGIKRALGKYSVAPTLDFDQESSFSNIDVNLQRPGAHIEPAFTTVTLPSKGNIEKGHFESRPFPSNWQELYKTEQVGDQKTITIPSKWNAEPSPADDYQSDDVEINPYQIHNRYIVSPIKSGLIVIDQQAAHERILFERYFNTLSTGKSATQKQLFPQSINLNGADAVLLKDLLDEINGLGFDIQEFGNNDFVIHGVPADITGGNEQEIIEGLIEQFKQNHEQLNIKKRENVVRSMAVQTGIKAGKSLSVKEMKALIDELFACKDFYMAPNGRLTFIRYTLDDLEKQFEKK